MGVEMKIVKMTVAALSVAACMNGCTAWQVTAAMLQMLVIVFED